MLDVYSLKARIYPIVILLSPIILVAFAYSIYFDNFLHVTTSFGLAGVMGYLLSQLSRDLGKNIEAELWESWGGAPSTQLLRITNTEIDRATKERYHQRLNKICPISGSTLDYNRELNSSSASDEIYNAWAKYLIGQTRDTKKFNLLFKENVNYGFRRNLLALKKIAVTLIVIIFICVYLYSFKETTSLDPRYYPNPFWYSAFSLSVALAFWLLVVTGRWVKVPAYAYASRLYEAVDQL